MPREGKFLQLATMEGIGGPLGCKKGIEGLLLTRFFDGQLSIATLSITFGGAALAMGGKKVEKTTTPPLNAKNNDEEKFIK